MRVATSIIIEWRSATDLSSEIYWVTMVKKLASSKKEEKRAKKAARKAKAEAEREKETEDTISEVEQLVQKKRKRDCRSSTTQRRRFLA